MSLTKLTANLNKVSSLPDKPSLQPDELKAVFDEAGNNIKDYINETLTVETEKLIDDTAKATKISLESTLDENITQVEKSITDTVEASKATLETTFNAKIAECKVKDDFAVFTGDMILTAGTVDSSETTTKRIAYPTGFTKENCVVLSQGIKLKSDANGFAYGSTSEVDVFTWAKGLSPFRVILEDTILIEIDNYLDKRTISYKIVLIKV